MTKQVKIFDYIPELDAFVPTKEYKELAIYLGLVEWTYVVWMGRLFIMDDDYGEHWFDNWDERELVADKALGMGYNPGELYIINPKRFTDGRDGVCHTDEERKLFWTDVLKSLTLSLDTLFLLALNNNPKVGEDEHLPIKKRIRLLKERFGE